MTPKMRAGRVSAWTWGFLEKEGNAGLWGLSQRRSCHAGRSFTMGWEERLGALGTLQVTP